MLQLANLRSATEESLQWIELDLAEVLKWSLAQVQPIAKERMIEIEKKISSSPIVAVEDYMKMLFINLLSNAIYYSQNGGRVYVQCHRMSGEELEVIIEDKGIGIPREKLPRIFEEYYRTNEAVLFNKASSGLGLTIVEHVARTHKIRIRIESQPGVGTKFILTFPHARKKQHKKENIKKEIDYVLTTNS